MSPGFVTQLVSEKPQVVAIADQLDLLSLRQSLTAQSLDVVEITPTEVLAPGFTWPTETYKIIWFCQITSASLSQVAAIAQRLIAAPVPAVVVIIGSTPLKNAKPVFTSWQLFSDHQAAVFSTIFQKLATTPLLFAQDVVISPRIKLPALEVMTQSLTSGTVIDPEVGLYPQLWSSFSQSLAKLIIKPGLTSTTIRGKKISSTTLAKLVQLYAQRVTGVLPIIQSTPAQTAEVTEFPIVDNFATYSLDDLANELVKDIKIVTPVAGTEAKLPNPDFKPDEGLNKINENRLNYQSNPPNHLQQIEPKFTSATPPTPQSKTPPLVATPTTKAVTSRPTTQSSPQPTLTRQPTELDAEMNRLFQTYRSDHKVKRVKNMARDTVKTNQKNHQRSWLFKGGIASAAIAMVVVLLTVGYLVSAWWLKQAVVTAIGNPNQRHTKISLTLASVVDAQNQLYGLVFDPILFSQNGYLVDLIQSGPTLVEKQNQLAELGELAYLQAIGRQTGQVFTTVSQAAVTAQSLYEVIAQNQAWLKKIDLSADPKIQASLVDYTDELNQAKKALLPVQQLQPLLSHLLGGEGRRTYAVLFQNPQELRPTGGFIQSAALLTFDRGVLINSQVISAYELDKSVPGVVQPPNDLQQLLGEQQWYFRDSNWQPDFPTAAAQVTWFMEKGLNTTVDGVIGLNAYVIRDLLRVMGPVELPEYNEIITDRNLLERLEFHSELQLVDPDKDYSTLLFNRVFQKMSNISQAKAPALLEVIRQNFDAKQMTMSLKNEAELLTLTNLGWSGALLQPACPVQLESSDCLVDTVAQVESNVGVNKANAYIDRDITHGVVISDAQAIHTRTMSFKNTATSNAWPKGTYKNYLRLYVSPEAQIEQVIVNGSPLPLTQVLVRTENNKKVFGFLVEVAPQQTSVVQVSYTVPHQFSDNYTYAVFNQQQPGIATPPLTISIQHPDQVQPTLIAPQAAVEGNTILFNQLTLPHSFVGVVFK